MDCASSNENREDKANAAVASVTFMCLWHIHSLRFYLSWMQRTRIYLKSRVKVVVPPDTHSLCAAVRGRRDTTTTTWFWGIRLTGGDSIQPEKQSTQKEQPPIEQSNQRTNLTRFGQRAYILGAREREIFIDSTINTNYYKREFLREARDSLFFSGI